MKKLFRVTDKDTRYPSGVKKKVLKEVFGDKAFDVDIYGDDDGKLFYKDRVDNFNGNGPEAFYPLRKNTFRICYVRTEFYLKAENNIYVLGRVSYQGCDELKKVIEETMPADDSMYRVFAPGEWGSYNVKTKRHCGAIVNCVSGKEREHMRLPGTDRVVSFHLGGYKAFYDTSGRHRVKLKLVYQRGSIFF